MGNETTAIRSYALSPFVNRVFQDLVVPAITGLVRTPFIIAQEIQNSWAHRDDPPHQSEYQGVGIPELLGPNLESATRGAAAPTSPVVPLSPDDPVVTQVLQEAVAIWQSAVGSAAAPSVALTVRPFPPESWARHS